MKNKKIKNTAKTILCILLCVIFSFQSFAFTFTSDGFKPTYDEKYKNQYLIANIEDAIAKSIGKINPTLDELLDLYVKEGLYDLTREQAITSMLRNFLVTNPDMVPILGNSLLTAFDAFGGYYPQTTNQEIFSTVYKGYGIVLDGKKMLDGNKYYVIIKQVFEESPADKAGLKVGDEIIKVGGINVEGFGVGAVSNLLAVQPDKAGITVKRGVKNIDISVTRGTVYIQSISFSADDATKTATITIADFVDEYMLYDLFFVMMFLIENEYKNIIFDLRDNPGGNKWNMLEILNAFVPEKGAVIYSEIDKKGKTEKIESLGDGIEFDKICILTNSHSASASEVFALSLRELTGAVIIGEKTFGKGIGQLYTSLSNGDVAAITVFEVLSAKGTRYHKKGVEPDIKILPEYIDAENRTFSQLNFVNCLNVRKGADNKAVLALNQRLARIGYISPEDITSKCTDKTITAVEILQKYNKLPVGISKIDYKFIECLNYYLKYAPLRYEDGDVQYECAKIYIEQGREAAEDYAAESAKKAAEKNAENDEKPAA